MSVIIKSCSPGTKCQLILNDQAIIAMFKADEIDAFLNDDDARSLDDIGTYIGYSKDFSVQPATYSGESHTEDSGGVQVRISEHKTKKPILTDYMVLLNTTVDGHRKINGTTFEFFEHIFHLMLKYANKSDVLNVKRTGGKVSPEIFQKVICPTLLDMKYCLDGSLDYLLTPNNDLPGIVNGSKGFILNNDDNNQIFLKEGVILKHSHFKFPHKKIRESNDSYSLLCNLINAGLCIPYVYKKEVVMKFVIDVNLNTPHIINGSQKKDFFINERALVNLMGSTKEFEKSFK